MQSAWDNHALACNFAKYSPISKIFHSHSAINLFLICLLTTPPHLKYVVTLPYNLSLMAFFADINISQGSVATYARCGGILNSHLTANLLINLQWNFFKSVKIWQNYGHESVAPLFGPPCTLFVGITRVHIRNGTSIGSAVFAGLANVSNT